MRINFTAKMPKLKLKDKVKQKTFIGDIACLGIQNK